MGTIQTPDRMTEAVAAVKTLADEREYTLRHLMNLVRMPIGNHEAVELAGIARAHGVSLAGLQQAADREAGLDFDTEADPRYHRRSSLHPICITRTTVYNRGYKVDLPGR